MSCSECNGIPTIYRAHIVFLSLQQNAYSFTYTQLEDNRNEISMQTAKMSNIIINFGYRLTFELN